MTIMQSARETPLEGQIDQQSPLGHLFRPRSVAVIGATENAGSVGRTVLANLIQSPFGGTVYPVNPKRASVLGVKAYKTIKDVPDKVDLAVIVTPAPTVPAIIGDCAALGIPAAIIISAGFKELGPEGEALEQQVKDKIQGTGMRILGPNCLGLMNPILGLNATFAATCARPGKVAFLSQSGALCTAVLDWSLRELVGFSAFVSAGSMLDVGWGDLIDYFGNDPHTQSILIYMESVGDARAFMSAAREVALKKPIIVIKPGRTAQASKAAASHTGALTGSDEVLDAAFRRAGVLRVNNIADLFYTAEVIARQPHPKGPRLTILTNAGGPGVLATDAIIGAGGELAAVSPETVKALNAFLPAAWSHSNPIDILGDASPERYAKTLELAAKDPNSDGLLVILTPQAMSDATGTAEALKPYADLGGKPVLASWMGGGSVAPGEAILNQAGIPTFPYPDTAARAFQYMWQYTLNLRSIYETPAMLTHEKTDDRLADSIISTALSEDRCLLDEAESKKLLAAYGIPTVRTDVATTAEAAVRCADACGYPVVLKLYSRTITHKTDVGGVKLNLKNAQEVRTAFHQIHSDIISGPGEQHFQGVTVQPMIKLPDAYEVILGSSVDPQFGPVLLFGTGGQLVEVFKDRALGLPPLNATLARRMMERTQIFKALSGVRGRKPVDIAALEGVLVAFSQLVLDQPRIKEIDINPLLVSPKGLMALDARVLLHPLSVLEKDLPRPAIRPYPAEYATSWTSKDGVTVAIRPITPEDEPLLAEFHGKLSAETVRARYFSQLSLSHRISHERLSRVCFNDYDREVALVAEYRDHESGRAHILAVARLVRTPGSKEAEFAIVVADIWQNRGLGTEMAERLLVVAEKEGLTSLVGSVASDNTRMQRMMEKLGFVIDTTAGDPYVARKQMRKG
ncbi:MAG TPA: bifunctional acetate--CoA ligase family protein/GNAT family N-acetyltransferase [Phycisphaerae bacterium]|nr:bifunctional acetate--CoA ligase family protein/GNAT family N-acetyltransferase [Phycisphaerae bacterium]